MENESQSPDEPNEVIPPAPPAPLEPDSPAVATDLEDSFFETRRLRKDGWDGTKMASFCGNLAETGVVTFACRASGMSAQSAYGLRHRHPVFAKAWETALSLARERLADELLARSLKGGAEQLMRDGCIVAERHTFDNKLAFAMLRRLDHRAELGTTFRTPAAWEIPVPAPAVKGQWQDLLDALSEERSDDAMRLLEPPKVDSEVDDPPFEGVEGDELEEPYVEKRVWQEFKSGDWRTNFPPPPGFAGFSRSSWEKHDYSRALTAAELDAFTSDGADKVIVTLAQDEADRDAFFAALATPAPPPSTEADTSPKTGGAATQSIPSPSQGKVSARSDDGGGTPADGGGTPAKANPKTPKNPTNDCPPPEASATGDP